jgi:integrase
MAGLKLSAKKVENAKSGRHGDGAGLWLAVSPTLSKRWIYRFTISGRVSEIALGLYPAVSLEDARDRALAQRKLHKAGTSPALVKKKAAAAAASGITFGALAAECIEMRAVEWRNAKHKQQWANTLSQHAALLANMRVSEITEEHVLRVLRPIWLTKPETASRVRGRIETVLDYAKAKKLRTGENPAAWRGNLSHLLPKTTKLSRGHFAAMPYDDVPAFIQNLRGREGITSLAFEMKILTAARSEEIRRAKWDEIDLKKKIWTIPAERMKANRAHRVPLSDRVVVIIKTLKAFRANDYLFVGNKPQKPISTGAIEMSLRRMDIEGCTPHGFRSSFRDWCGDKTNFQREVIEAALAHVIGDKVEAAYRREDALEKRRALMQAWADYCGGITAENVVPFSKAAS